MGGGEGSALPPPPPTPLTFPSPPPQHTHTHIAQMLRQCKWSGAESISTAQSRRALAKNVQEFVTATLAYLRASRKHQVPATPPGQPPLEGVLAGIAMERLWPSQAADTTPCRGPVQPVPPPLSISDASVLAKGKRLCPVSSPSPAFLGTLATEVR